MSIKPILFNTDMVHAIREDRKTVTRRLAKGYALEHLELDTDGSIIGVYNQFEGRVFPVMEYAPCQPGDILWVREAWAQLSDLLGDRPGYIYRADLPQCDLDELKRKKFRWRPSIHMPRKAARLFLRVTDVRVERLHEITIAGMRMEGVTRRELRAEGCSCAWKTETCMDGPCRNRARYEYSCWMFPFSEVWDSTIRPGARTLYGWIANPWVWVIEFERCEKPEVAS